MWRIFGFDTVTRNPLVTACHVHPEGGHRVSISNSATHEQRITAADQSTSDLLEHLGSPFWNHFNIPNMFYYYQQYTITMNKNSSPLAVKNTFYNVVSKRTTRYSNHVARFNLKTLNQDCTPSITEKSRHYCHIQRYCCATTPGRVDCTQHVSPVSR